MSAPHPYAGLPASLATKHAKDRAIGPPLSEVPGLRILVPSGIDTDHLGTFTGEVERPGPPRETALAKARLGIEASGLARGVASEGSFGPDPRAFFVSAGVELMAFVDLELGLEVVEQRLSRETNFAHTTAAELDHKGEDFLARVGFPSHAIVVRANAGGSDGPQRKGVRRIGELIDGIKSAALASADGRARLETDMRAHLNPTRMEQIGVLAERLGTRLGTLCPDCEAPGYGMIEARPGLPCACCQAPTEWIAVEVDGCGRCDSRSERQRSDGLVAVDPGYCPSCNP